MSATVKGSGRSSDVGPEPPRVSVEDALKSAGEEAVYYHTPLTDASNSRAKAQRGFAPRPLLLKGA
nr:hypothetical protein [Rhizobium sullae]